jgi:3-methyl-2-oxobutanoate hydroxymethyltransferase
VIRAAVEQYREDVEHRAFPSDEESYHLPQAAKRELESAGRQRLVRPA